MKFDVIVVGGGPAGMMAAIQAALRGLSVVVLEKNDRLGRKLRICGKGRCNVTNDCDRDTLMANIPGNGRFLFSSLSQCSNHDIIRFFESIGVPLKTERGGRVFPVSDQAADVIDALLRFMKDLGITVRTGTTVTGVSTELTVVTGVRVSGGEHLQAAVVIIATGGLSYPQTGSTGDGYRFAENLGLMVTPPKPSLVPLITEGSDAADMQGLSLKNVAVKFYDTKKHLVFEDFGEMLFTHYGVSGPVILSGSRHIMDSGFTGCTINIDMKPALEEKMLDQRIQKDFSKYANRMFENALDDLLPRKMIPVIIRRSGILNDKLVHQITREERQSLVRILKNFTLEVQNARPVTEAIITAGGVSIRELKPGTMASKKYQGLYFAGEIIDADGYTGGFNLTIAFSTGFVAGSHCEG